MGKSHISSEPRDEKKILELDRHIVKTCLIVQVESPCSETPGHLKTHGEENQKQMNNMDGTRRQLHEVADIKAWYELVEGIYFIWGAKGSSKKRRHCKKITI